MKLFKNYKTKRQLRKEIADLKALMLIDHSYKSDTYDVVLVRSSVLVNESLKVDYYNMSLSLAQSLMTDAMNYATIDEEPLEFEKKKRIIATLRILNKKS